MSPGGGRWPRMLVRVVVGLVLSGGWILATPRVAGAHASFVTASRGPGSGQPTAPGEVAIRFSEALNRRLSRIRVLDRAGVDVGDGPTRALEGDPFAMRRKLGLLRPGVYTVRWVSLSRLDSHTLRGTYSFGVGTSAGGAEHVAVNPVASEGWLGLAGRWLAFMGLGLWLGRALLVSAARRAGLDERRLAVLARVAPAVAFVGTGVAAASSALVASGTLTRVADAFTGPSGNARGAELALAGIGVLIGSRWRLAQIPLAALAVILEASAGHAASSTSPVLATASFAVHLAAAGSWVFVIVAAVLAPNIRRALGVFSPYAVAAAAAVVAFTGALNAVVELNGFDDLTATAYGRTLLVKVAALTAMAGFGLAHNRRRRRVASSDRAIRRPLGLELGAAAVALATATALVGFPNPPRSAEPGETAGGTDSVLANLASKDALSLGDASGPFVVGLTVVPARPGPVELRLQLLGVEAGDGVRNVRVGLRAPSGQVRSTALAPCGLGCFSGRTVLGENGAWSYNVAARSRRGSIVATFGAQIPTPDGGPTLARALAGVARLRSATMHEDLRGTPGSAPFQSDYRFSAPDAFEFKTAEHDEIVIGGRQYERDAASAAWRSSAWPGSPFSWPANYYASFWKNAAAARIVGTENIDGVPTTIVAFVRTDLPAWLRLWVDGDGVVRREQMRAEGHLMDHTYTDFNTAPPIEPPA